MTVVPVIFIIARTCRIVIFHYFYQIGFNYLTMLKSFLYHNLTEAGCDEAGRGCLAGPVVAAAVILPKNYKHPVLNDSKKLSAKQRAILKDEIINSAIDWKVAFVDNSEIDEMNILRASIKAMHIAIEGLEKEPQFLLIDGNRFYPYKSIKPVSYTHLTLRTN